jgi:hypothetical protein
MEDTKDKITVITIDKVPVMAEASVDAAARELTGDIIHDNQVVLDKAKERHKQDVEAKEMVSRENGVLLL